MLLKGSQALLYKHQAIVESNGDESLSRSSIGKRRSNLNDLNVSKFESFEFTEQRIQGKESAQNLQGPVRIASDSKSGERQEKPPKTGADNKHFYESQSVRESGEFDDQSSINSKGYSKLEPTPIANSRKQPGLYLTGCDNQDLDNSAQINANMVSFNPDHIPFQYNKRWEVYTPDITNRFSEQQLLTQAIGKLESSRFNDFKMEFLAFQNPISNKDAKQARILDDSELNGEKGVLNHDLLVPQHPNLLSAIEDELPGNNPKKTLMPKIKNMTTLTSVEENAYDPSSRNSRVNLEKPLLFRREDFFAGPDTNRSDTHQSRSSIAQSKKSEASIISKESLKRFSKDPNSIFAKIMPKTARANKQGTAVELNSIGLRTRVSRTPKTILRQPSTKEDMDRCETHSQCRCQSPAIQINISSNGSHLLNDNSKVSQEKRISIDIKGHYSKQNSFYKPTTESPNDLLINVTQAPALPSLTFEHDKRTVAKSLSSINNLQKVLNNKLAELEGKVGSSRH